MANSLYETVFNELNRRRGTWDEIAKGSGVPRKTIEKIGYGAVKNPGVLTVEKLAAYFRAQRAA